MTMQHPDGTPSLKIAYSCAVCSIDLMIGTGKSFHCLIHKPIDGSPNILLRQALSMLGLRIPDTTQGATGAQQSISWCCTLCYGEVYRTVKTIYELRNKAAKTGMLIVDPFCDVLKVAVVQSDKIDDEMEAAASPSQLMNVTPENFVAASSKQVERPSHITPTKLPHAKKVNTRSSNTPVQGMKRQIGAITSHNLSRRNIFQKSRMTSSGCSLPLTITKKCGIISESALYRRKMKENDPKKYQVYLDKQKQACKIRREKLKHNLSSSSLSCAAKQHLLWRRGQGRLRQKIFIAKKKQTEQSSLPVVPDGATRRSHAIAAERQRRYRASLSSDQKKSIRKKDKEKKARKRFSEAHLPTVDIVTKMMEPTTSTSTDGADGPALIKEEPNDDGSQTVLCYNQSDMQLSSQQPFADHELDDCKNDIPIINITPLVGSDNCVSKSEEDNLTVKSEPETSNPTFDKCEVVPNVVPNLYEVKNEFPCITQTEIVHNNRLDVSCEVIVVKEELDCKPEIVDNVDVPGDVNIQTDVQYNDTVKEEPHTSMEICEADVKEEHTLVPGESDLMIPRDRGDSGDPDEDDDSNDSDEDEETFYSIKSFSCTRCEMSFTSMEELTSHCETHKTALEHYCDVCGKSFKWKSNLKRHQLIHSGERPFKCNVCDKSFTRKSHLIEHMAIHSIARPFKCEVCDTSFIRKGSLTRHLLVHTGERPFKCKDCDKSFTQKGHLAMHFGIHHGERPFKCDVCNKSFVQQSHLTEHMAIHSIARPFKCDVCDISFTQKGSLTRHLATHSKDRQFECKDCDKSFARKDNLAMHILIHSGERPFKCKVCGTSFTQKSSLTRHLSTHTWE